MEVYEAVNNLTPEEREIALFWADDPGITSTPPGHWVNIVSQLCVGDDLPLGVAAEAYARVGIAMADAFITCWQAKFTHKELREVCRLPGWQAALEPADLELNEASRVELAHPDRANEARNLDILNSLGASAGEAGRTIRLHFQRAPVALQGRHRLERVVLEAQRLVGPAFEQRAEPAGRLLELDAGLLFRSVGYRSEPMPGLRYARAEAWPLRPGAPAARPRPGSGPGC